MSLSSGFAAAAAMPVVANGGFRGSEISGRPGDWIAADSEGRAALLIRQAEGGGKPAPILLRNLQVTFGVAARVSADGTEIEGSFAVMVCEDVAPSVVAFFLAACESIVALLDLNPTGMQISEKTSGLADLFARLTRLPSGSLLGLVGDLTETWDFFAEPIVVDSKATITGSRLHDISFAQANPDAAFEGYFASVLIRRAANGASVVDLMASLQAGSSLGQRRISKIQRIVAETLGTALDLDSLHIDVKSSLASIRLYRTGDVPRLSGSVPDGVHNIRFQSDFDLAAQWFSLDALPESIA
jgi:hypothetical protein